MEFKTEFALFDTGADVNSLSYEVWERIGKPTLCESKTTLMSFSKDTNGVQGYLETPIFIGNTNVHHRFYVMKPSKANTSVVLGQPWHRTYNGVPNWRREGYNFEYDHARLFVPFLKDEDFATDTESEDEEDLPTPNEPAAITTIAETKQEELPTPTIQPQEEAQQTQQEAKPDRTPTNAQIKDRHNGIWVPKTIAQAQQGATHMWVPKTATKVTRLPAQKTQKPPRRQARNSKEGQSSQKKRQSTRARKKCHQRTSKRHDIVPNYQQIWVKKELLRAQGDSTYKWVPKRLIRHATSPTQMPAGKKQSNPQRKRMAAQIKKKWIPKDVLAKQGYYDGITQIWVPKSKASQSPSKQQGLGQQRQHSKGLTQQVWIPKAKEGSTTKESAKETGSQRSKGVPKVTRKATAQEKGKWIPKVATTPTISYEEQLPGTSNSSATVTTTTTTDKQCQIQPFKGSSHLEMARQLAFILRTFNSKQVEAQWKQHMATKVAGNVSSTAKALGPQLLQDPYLAPH